MTTHSSILVWRIPWTEDPSGLPTTGWQRIGHNWSDLARKYARKGETGRFACSVTLQDLRQLLSVPVCAYFVDLKWSLQLCDPIVGIPLGSSVPGILQARTLEWVAISFSSAWKWKVKVKSLSRARLLATPWTAAYQAPPSMGFSRQEYWSGVPLPSPLELIECQNGIKFEKPFGPPAAFWWCLEKESHLANISELLTTWLWEMQRAWRASPPTAFLVSTCLLMPKKNPSVQLSKLIWIKFLPPWKEIPWYRYAVWRGIKGLQSELENNSSWGLVLKQTRGREHNELRKQEMAKEVKRGHSKKSGSLKANVVSFTLLTPVYLNTQSRNLPLS